MGFRGLGVWGIRVEASGFSGMKVREASEGRQKGFLKVYTGLVESFLKGPKRVYEGSERLFSKSLLGSGGHKGFIMVSEGTYRFTRFH